MPRSDAVGTVDAMAETPGTSAAAGWWAAGIAIGLAIGIGIGIAIGNVGAGIAIGAGIGVAFGFAFSEFTKRKGSAAGDGDRTPPR